MRAQERLIYGWVVVATSALGLLFGAFPIVVSAFAIFFKAYLHEFQASRAAISLALTIHNIVAALLCASIGRLTDRFGGRKVILPGLGLLGVVLLLAETIGSRVWHVYIFYAVLGAVSGATTSVPYSVVVSRWFARRRGLALGLTMVGLGVGAMVVPPLVQELIAGYGWRSAFAIAGGAILMVPMPIVGLFLKEAPQSIGRLPAPRQPEGLTWPEIRHSPAFWWMNAAFVLASAGTTACIVHMAALFSDRGATPAAAALAVSVAGFALLAGRAGTGFLLDRYFGPHVAMSLFAIAGLGIALLWSGGTGGLALTGAFLVGLGLGAEVDIVAYLMGRYFGLLSLGRAFGFAFGVFVLASGLGPLIMGFAFDRTGSYGAPLAGFFFATMAAAALMGRLGPYRFAAEPKGIQSAVPATPMHLLRLTDGLIVHQSLCAAAQLGIADLLEDGARSTADLAATLQVSHDALYRTLRFLAGQGVFHEVAPQVFANSSLSEWLRSEVPGSIRSILIYRGSPFYFSSFGDLLYSIETGAPAREKAHGENGFEQLRRNPEAGRRFDDAMTELSMLWAPGIAAAYDFGRWGSLMDVGGGSGLLLATILKAHPGLRGVLAEQPEVLERARQRGFWSQDLAGRVRFEPADFFRAVPTGCRAYLMKNVIHDWDDERAREILRSCRRAIPDDGVLLLVEYSLGGDNTPTLGKAIDVVMLTMTGGKERTVREHRELLASAGFYLRETVPIAHDVMIIEARPAP